MKNVLLIGLTLFGTAAFGSHTVCSSPSLYYSSVRHDFGTAPLPGMELGTLQIFAQGKLLVDQKFTQGLGGFTIRKYDVAFVGPKVVVKKTGSQVAGSAIYTDTAVLSTSAPGPVAEVLRTPVVCENTWAMVP